jgi:hypothetical protein
MLVNQVPTPAPVGRTLHLPLAIKRKPLAALGADIALVRAISLMDGERLDGVTFRLP